MIKKFPLLKSPIVILAFYIITLIVASFIISVTVLPSWKIIPIYDNPTDVSIGRIAKTALMDSLTSNEISALHLTFRIYSKCKIGIFPDKYDENMETFRMLDQDGKKAFFNILLQENQVGYDGFSRDNYAGLKHQKLWILRIFDNDRDIASWLFYVYTDGSYEIFSLPCVMNMKENEYSLTEVYLGKISPRLYFPNCKGSIYSPNGKVIYEIISQLDKNK